MTDSVDESWSAAEQRAHERLWLDRTLRRERASEQNGERSARNDLACYRHGVLLQGKKGNTRPRRGRTEFPAWDTFAPDGAKGVVTRVAAHEKKKAPRSLRTEGLAAWRAVESMHEAWPKAHHMAPPDLAIRQRQLCSGARPSAQPKSLARRDRNRFRSLQGRVTSATPIPRYWTSCMAG